MVAMIKLVLPALVLIQVLPAAEPARLTDAQMEEMAKQALVSADAKFQASTLHQLQVHHFKATQTREKELGLYAQGTLEDRLGQPARAAVTFHKLETLWPHSPYLAETQVVMAQAAVEHNSYKEAESRLRKALGADLPVESLRRAQELYLWVLADQGRAAEGVDMVNGLRPLGDAKATEKGLVGIMEAYCAAHKRADAQSTLNAYRQHYAKNSRLHRVELDFAKLLGTLGEAGASAQAFQKLIVSAPDAPESDEARLALATLLADGRLSSKEAKALPSPKSLLAQLDKAALKDAPARQALVLKLRVALKDRQWQEVLDTAARVRALHPTETEALQITTMRQEGLRGLVQELLDKHQATATLPYLNADGINCLTPAQRLALATTLAQAGLPEASSDLMNASPAAEKPALRRAILQVTAASDPRGALAFLPPKGESPQESLTRAEANAALRAWPETRAALAMARPGTVRIQTIMTLLNRPLDPKETSAARLKEAEGWLARAREKGADREPLVLLVADRKAREGNWQGALALYPVTPQAANRGWVAYMRATCLTRMGKVDGAKRELHAAEGEAAFKTEREALAQQLAR
jgi:hypothetical protein